MSNSSTQAKLLLEKLGITGPGDMTMEEIAWSCGLVVTKKEMEGCDGRIIMNANSGIISINSNINYEPKINYVLAHEIGHALLHTGLTYFSDTDKTLSEWYAKGNHENEANQFAAELLMPSEHFIRLVKKKKLSVQLVEYVANYFGASKTATFLRYRDLGDFPIMVVFVEDGIIKWKSNSTDFPFKWLPLHSKVPAWTVAGDFHYKGIALATPEKVDAIEWFEKDFNIRGNETQKLWEQCFPVSDNAFISCIWTT